MYAGGRGANNTSYYLYNGQNYWTMSPFYWNGYAYVFVVDAPGFLYGDYVHNSFGIRPVINLNPNVTFSSGNGSLDTPFIVAD